MRIGDYYRGTDVDLVTKLPPEEVERRINDGAASILSPFATGVIGWARFGAIRLRIRRNAFIRNDAKPILAGRIQAERSGSRLHLRYRGPLPMLVFFPFCYAFILLSAALLLFLEAEPEAEAMLRLMLPPMLLVFLCAPALVLYLALRGADADRDALVAFLKTSLTAQEVPPRQDLSGLPRR